jgi:hypothetical protein
MDLPDLKAGNFKLSDNLIEKNISIVTEYYKWLIAKNSKGKPCIWRNCWIYSF